MRISVVVPVLDAREGLSRLIAALEAQTKAPEEILIVDNGSTDGSVEWLRDRGVRVLSCERRSSYAARNAGILQARGDAIAFTDADCVPRVDWLERGAERLAFVPRVAGRVHMIAHTWVERLDADRFLRQERYASEGFGATANLFVRRHVFDEVGFFDERLVSNGDHELGVRAKRFPIAYAPDAIVDHPCRATFARLARKAVRVGTGVGQSIRFHGAPNPRRLVDRASLAGRGPILMRAGHIALAVCTAYGVARGVVQGG